MRILFLRCHIRYGGRIDAELELGDRLVVVKDCGATKVEGSGLKEKNWMPSGSVIDQETPDYIRITHRRGEVLEIFIEQRFFEQELVVELDGRLIKMGNEREVSDLLAERPDAILPGAAVVQREYRTPVGPLDLLMLAGPDYRQPVIVEVKRQMVSGAGAEVVYQLRRYMDAIVRMEEWAFSPAPHGIIVAKGFSKPVQAAAKELGVTLVRAHYEQLKETPAAPRWAVTDGDSGYEIVADADAPGG